MPSTCRPAVCACAAARPPLVTAEPSRGRGWSGQTRHATCPVVPGPTGERCGGRCAAPRPRAVSGVSRARSITAFFSFNMYQYQKRNPIARRTEVNTA